MTSNKKDSKPTKSTQDIDLKKVFQEEEFIEEEGMENAPKQDLFLNDNSHMKQGKEGVDLKAGDQLSKEDIQNFTNPMSFKESENRNSDILFFCKECKYKTEERPKEKKPRSYNFICPNCGTENMVWGTKSSLSNQYKFIDASKLD